MPHIPWDDSLETGDAAVDAQHRELFEMFDEIVEAVDRGQTDDAVRDVLERLSNYISVHFSMERELMESVGLGEELIEAHVTEHQKLTQRTREMILEWRTGQLEAIDLVDFLIEWLTSHIERMDKVLALQARAARSQAE